MENVYLELERFGVSYGARQFFITLTCFLKFDFSFDGGGIEKLSNVVVEVTSRFGTLRENLHLSHLIHMPFDMKL